MLLDLKNAPIPEVGAPAPDFTLRSANGHDVTLSSYRNKRPVLLAFFPLAFTSTCTAEMCAFNDDFDVFAATGVEILPISVDSTASLREYRAKYNLGVDLLSDFRRSVSAAYGVLLEDRFYSKRAYFLIDVNGIVRWAHVENQTRDRRDNAEILRRIQFTL